MNTDALFKLGYGLYILSCHENGKDNACIVNTVMQITSNPCKIIVCINKTNHTCKMLQNTKKLNISILDEETEFDIFKHFGYQSGKDVDKFLNFIYTKRTPNGVLYVTKNTNAYLSAFILEEIDLDTHIMFIAQLVEAEVLSEKPTVTYDYYQKNIKPKPEKSEKKGWRCKICNYIYEGEDLPPDFICPWCKHGVVDFEKI